MKTFVLLFFVFAAPTSFASCSEDLTGPSAGTQIGDDTTNFLAYLGELVSIQLVSTDDLQGVLKRLDKDGKILNPIVVFDKTEHRIHFEGLQDYINAGTLDAARVATWIRTALHLEETVQAQRADVANQTRHETVGMEFYRIEPDHFLIGSWDKRKSATLTQAFEAMPTNVTQYMWVTEMGANPSHFFDGETVLPRTNGKAIPLRPNNPVENITWWSALAFANRISEKMGLPQVYDLTGIRFLPGTSAEEGTWATANSSDDVKINAPDGNIYKAKGIRLPTEAELQFLRSDRGRSTVAGYFNDMNAESLQEFIWSAINAQNQTHPVDSLLPFFIDDKPFQDLYGNVGEWTGDWIDKPAPKWGWMPGARDWRGANRGTERVVVGTDYQTRRVDITTPRSGRSPNDRTSLVGIRLVRSAP